MKNKIPLKEWLNKNLQFPAGTVKRIVKFSPKGGESMIRKLLVALFVLSFAGSLDVWAGPAKRTPGVNRRQARQAGRIHQGVKSGQLTKEEAKGLRQDERGIQKMKKDAKSDGKVTIEERKDLHQALNAESKKIYEEKHDGETRNEEGVK